MDQKFHDIFALGNESSAASATFSFHGVKAEVPAF